MAGSTWGGMPSYISNIFRRRRDPINPVIDSIPLPEMETRAPQSARARATQGFDQLMSEMNPTQAAAPRESAVGTVGRGLASFLGFVPQGGTRGDATEGFANAARALFQAPSIQQVEADYNQSLQNEKIRRAIESGDMEALSRLDPERAIRLGSAQRQAQSEQDAQIDSRKVYLGRTALAISRETGMDYGDVIERINMETGGFFSPEEVQAAKMGGHSGLMSMLGQEDPNRDRFLKVGGDTVIDLDRTASDSISWNRAPRTQEELDKTLADIELARARGRLSDAQAQAALRNAEANYLRAQKYDSKGGASGGGFAGGAAITGALSRAYEGVEAANQNGVFLDPNGSRMSAAIAAFRLSPEILENPQWLAAMAVTDPKGLASIRAMQQSQRDLMQAVRTLPGMDATRLADTPTEQEMLRQTALQYNGTYDAARRSLAATTMLFEPALMEYINDPNTSAAGRAQAQQILALARGDSAASSGIGGVLRYNPETGDFE